MPSVIQKLQTALSVARKSWNGGDWVNSSSAGNVYSSWGGAYQVNIVGSSVNWGGVTGDLLQNAAALSCYQWVWKNFCQAPLVIEKRGKEGKWEPVPDSPLLGILLHPNPISTWDTLAAGILHDLISFGNAFVGIERNGLAASELIWISAERVEPYKSDARTTLPLDSWRVRKADGGYFIAPLADMIHFRIGVNPQDPRLGFSPYRALLRQQFSLDECANYTANILRNMGVVGAIATPKEGSNQPFDAKEFTRVYNAKTRGDNKGEILAYDGAIDIKFPDTSPQKMALDTIADHPEADICAVMGVPAQVVGLHSGRLSKTYANVKEAKESAWEETVIPYLNLVTRKMTQALIGEDSGMRVHYDLSDIRPLQADLDALHARARADWLAGLIDRAEWKRTVGEQPLPEDDGVYYSPSQKQEVIP